MTETQFYNAQNKYFRMMGAYAWSVFTMHQNGVPDCFYRAQKAHGKMPQGKPPLWIEYKLVKAIEPKVKPTRKVKVETTELQRDWITHARENGEQAHVVVGVQSEVGKILGVVWLTDPLTTKIEFDWTADRLHRDWLTIEEFRNKVLRMIGQPLLD